ncbi:MAG: Calx-beta domain-containing protein, partial [Gammaproteobacteria bacterium]
MLFSSYVLAAINDPYLSIDDVIVEEGATAVFTVSLSSVHTMDVTVDFQTININALDGSDYLGNSGSLLIPAGTLQEQLFVSTINDTDAEISETFKAVLSNPINASLLDSIAIASIAPNDGPPCGRPAVIPSGQRVLAVYRACDDINQWFFEGFGDGTNQAFSYNLSITGDYDIAATKKINFESSDALTLPSPDTVKVKMAVKNTGRDTASISHVLGGSLCLKVNSPSNAVVIDSSSQPVPDFNGRYPVTGSGACGVPPFDLSIQDAVVNEGNDAEIIVSLSDLQNNPVTLNYVVVDGSATAPQDFIAPSGSMTFPSGITSQSIFISTIDEGFVETSESFSIVLSGPPVGGVLLNDTATITIIDAGGVQPPVSVFIDDVIISEGNVALVNVHLSGVSIDTVSVDYFLASGTAKENTDYIPDTGTLVFAPGVISVQQAITIIDDSVFEADESFSMRIDSAVNAVISDVSADITITDNDIPPCGRPAINAGSDKLLAVYRSCTDMNRWQFEVTGGGSSTAVKYRLQVESDQPVVSLGQVNFESNDSLILSSPTQVSSVMNVIKSGYDLAQINTVPG